MAIISSFLCWSNTRTGSAVCGYYTLVISVVCLAFYMLRYIALDEIKDSIELKGIVYAGFVLYSFLIGVSLILLPGVYMDRKFLLLPWIYVLVIAVLYETGAIALITTVHLEKDHTLSPWEIVAIVFYCIRLVANCYCFACVVSQYQELSEGRGTYDFLFKPRRRHMARGAPVADLEEYHPPYGASLPPYSEVNMYKEYCPPNYENLALDEESGGGDERRRWDASHYGLSLIGAVSRSGGGGSGGGGGRGLRGAASTSCLAEVHVSSSCTPPPGFEDIDIYGEDHDYDSISSSPQPIHHHHHNDHHRQSSSDSSNHHHQYLREVDDNDNGNEQHCPTPSRHPHDHHPPHQQQHHHHRNRHSHDRHHHHHYHRHHHHHQHHRHHSLPQTHHSQLECNSTSDDNYNNNYNSNTNNNNNINNHQIDFIHQHHRHRSTGSKPIATSSPIQPRRRLPDYNDLHLSLQHHSPYHSRDTTDLDTLPNTTRSCPSTPDIDTNTTCCHASMGKEPITMTESSGSFLSFSQTDFRTPTPKSSPALSVHSCHRLNNNNTNSNNNNNNTGSRSPPAIHKRTYITWI